MQATSGSAAAWCSVTPSGNRHHLAGGDGDELRVTAARQQSADLLPDGPSVDSVADLGDGPGHLESEGLAGARRGRIVARGLQQVGAVDTRRAHLDEDFTGVGCDIGDFLPGELVGCLGHDRAHSNNATTRRIQSDLPTPANACLLYHSEMEGMIAGRTASDMPGLDIAEQRSWQNFLDSALRMYATLNRALVDAHHLTLNDVRLLDMLDKSATGSARMGDLAEG